MDDIVAINANQICSDFHTFIDGSKRCVAKLRSATVGRGVYNPGWRWSIHAGPQTGNESERHFGWVQSGKMIVCTANKIQVEVGPGDFFEVGPEHDAWVVGDEPCVAFDFKSL
jgi:hypothetical protein